MDRSCDAENMDLMGSMRNNDQIKCPPSPQNHLSILDPVGPLNIQLPLNQTEKKDNSKAVSFF